MNTYPDDRELLGRYAGQGSEQAFTELVQRHLDFVFGVALREMHEPAAAADIAQAVFILLARKAASVPARASLSGWLFQAVRHVARNARRAAWRRARHEKEAALMSNPESTHEPDSDWDRLAPVLNDALASLSAGDRDVVTLRFFEKKSHTDIAEALGVPEASARPWSVVDYHRNGKSVRFHLHGPAGAQRLTLKLARQEMKRVEFVVRPSGNGA